MNRRLTFILYLLLFALPLAAQATRHRVGRIDVRGNVPASIVVSQSAVVEGRSYTDRDLDVAIARLRRLPFVYDARYSFEGETLVIEIDSMSRFFADVDALSESFENDHVGHANIGGGGRMFLGSGGVLQGQVREIVVKSNDAALADLEYSHYGIGGTRLFATAGASYELMQDEGSENDPTLRLLVGYPLTIRQTLSLSAADEGFRSQRNIPILARDIGGSSDRQLLNLRWTYDTTDDPYFALTGTAVNAGPSWTHEDSRFESLIILAPGGGPEPDVRVLGSNREGTTTSLGIDARNYWRLGARGAIFSALNLSRAHGEFDQRFDDQIMIGLPDIGFPFPSFQRSEIDTTDTALTVGYALNLFDRAMGQKTTRQRVELGATYARQKIDQPFDAPVGIFPIGGPAFDTSFTFDTTTLNAAYVLRRQYATVRLGLSYTFD